MATERKIAERETPRTRLAAEVRALCVARLRRHGIDWAKLEASGFVPGLRHAMAAYVPLPAGRGRPPSDRFRFVHQLERKDLIGAHGGPRGKACSRAELAALWLLVMGIDDLPADRLSDSARDVLSNEENTMKATQRDDRAGQPTRAAPRRPRGHG